MIRLKTIKNLFYSLILSLLSVAGDIENGKLKSASCVDVMEIMESVLIIQSGQN